MIKTTALGKHGEDRATDWLCEHGFKIVDRNWRSRWCEIDILATKSQCLYFVEVKYRKNANYGAGTDYITPKKLSQMQFAAEFWMHQHNYQQDCQLAVISIDGKTNELEFIDTL